VFNRLTIILIFFTLVNCSSEDFGHALSKIQFSKNLEKDYVEKLVDLDYLDQVKRHIPIIKENSYSNIPISKLYLELAQSYRNRDSIKFAFLINFYTLLAEKKGGLMNLEYLSKPSLNDLLSIYLTTSIGTNASYHNSGNIEIRDANYYTSEEVIEFELETLLSTHTLLKSSSKYKF